MKVKIEKVYWCKCGQTEHPHKGIILKNIHSQGRLARYRIVGTIEFCCREMEKAYDENFIQFKNIMNHPILHAIPIGCGLTINKTICYPECACEEEMFIYYCPFCGKEVVLEGLK